MISKIRGPNSVVFVSTVFESKFAMIDCKCKTFVAEDTNFNGLADFYKSRFESFRMEKSIFPDFAGFEGCTFGVEGLNCRT